MEIKESCGKEIETKCIVADFGKISDLQKYYYIANELKNIDVALLILNAGHSTFNSFSVLTG